MRQAIVLALVTAGVLLGCTDKRTSTEKLRADLDPKVAAFLIEAQRAHEAGNYNVALAWTDSAELYEPDLADLHFLRGVIYTQLNQLDIARYAYETVLELDPQYQGARFNMGLNHFRRGETREAVDLYTRELSLGETSGLWHELGRAYASMNEADSAETAYLNAIRLDSTNTTAIMWLGQLYEEIGELEKAVEYSKMGLEQRPENQDYRYIVGSLLHRLGRSEEAYEYLSEAAEKRQWHHGAQFNMGQVLMALGREDEAKIYFARADSAQQLQQSINEAQEEINRNPEILEKWTDLAALLRKAGQYDRAAEAYKVAVSIEPWNLYLQSNLALLMMEDGDLDGAIRRYRALVNIDSTLTDVWYNLGVAYANNGNYDLARSAWERVLRRRPGNVAVRESLERLDSMEKAPASQAPSAP